MPLTAAPLGGSPLQCAGTRIAQLDSLNPSLQSSHASATGTKETGGVGDLVAWQASKELQLVLVFALLFILIQGQSDHGCLLVLHFRSAWYACEAAFPLPSCTDRLTQRNVSTSVAGFPDLPPLQASLLDQLPRRKRLMVCHPRTDRH